jgi:DNA-directed RNA polymerase alpha subunit
MAITSYRIYCDECSRDVVIKESNMREHPWRILTKHEHTGICPVCNPSIDESAAEFDDGTLSISFTDLRGIGDGTAANLREAGFETRDDIRETDDETLLDISGVGKRSLDSLRSAT